MDTVQPCNAVQMRHRVLRHSLMLHWMHGVHSASMTSLGLTLASWRTHRSGRRACRRATRMASPWMLLLQQLTKTAPRLQSAGLAFALP